MRFENNVEIITIYFNFRFIKGFITRNQEPTADNRAFLNMAKVEWLKRLAKSLPKHVLHRPWPASPIVCREASTNLQRMHGAHLSRVYRLKLTPTMKKQFELKVLAEKIFKGKQKQNVLLGYSFKNYLLLLLSYWLLTMLILIS